MSKLDDLDKKLKEARADYADGKDEKVPESDAGTGSNIGYEFLAYVISGGIVGYVVDRFAGTLPWGLIIFIILGFVAGVYRANERMKNSD